jgi:ABC-type Fe3+/spermidine/putrescine transport system ATPase subunit
MSTAEPVRAGPPEQPDQEPEPMIELCGVTRRYEVGSTVVTALAPSDLVVRAGEFVVVLGPSGSGKTTLLNMIGALDVPSGGQVRVAGTAITGASRSELFRFRRETVSFVFQTFNLFPALTAEENVAFAIDVARRGRDGPSARDVLDPSASASASGTSRTSSPAASSSGWPSPGPSPPATRSCSPTSPPVSSTSAPAWRSSSCSGPRPSRGSPSSS